MQQIFKVLISVSLAASPIASGAAPMRTGKWIEANNLMLRYEMTGQGSQTVVLLHDMGMSLELWDELVPTIQANRRILRYDHRGFGLSEKFRGPVGHAELLGDLQALLDKLGLDKPVILVGESVGGALAIEFAAQHPERVKAVVAINPVIQLDVRPAVANPALAARSGAKKDTAAVFEQDGVRAYIKSDSEWLYPSRLRTPERWNRFMGIETAQDPQVRAAYMRMTPLGMPERFLAEDKVPTLVIAGMVNSSFDEAQWRKVVAKIPEGRLETIQSAHHAAFESPELVAPVLQRFLKEHR